MKLHVLVEGASDEALMRGWLPRFLPQHTFTVVRHRGKGRLSGSPVRAVDVRREGLLDHLPEKLRAYGRALDPATDRVVVLVDLDDDNCLDLKRRLVGLLDLCDPCPVVLFRIAIEESEAFYLGDRRAIKRAFPGANLRRLKQYEPDSVCSTWELFRDVIKARFEDKVGWAKQIAPHLTVDLRGKNANHSPSFNHLAGGLLRLVGESRR